MAQKKKRKPAKASHEEAGPEAVTVDVEAPAQGRALRVPEVVLIPAREIVPNPWNPNEEDEMMFNALVENIRQIGFAENIQLVPLALLEADYPEFVKQHTAEGKKYAVVGGEHRLKAVEYLDDSAAVPSVILTETDLDAAKLVTVRMNVIRGKLSPVKFMRLFEEMAAKYGEEATREMMALFDEGEFRKLVKRVSKALPPHLKEKLLEAQQDIKTIDGLSSILHELFRKYGSTVDVHIMAFTYGGKMHYMVVMDKKLFATMKEVMDWCAETKTDANELFNRWVPRFWMMEREGVTVDGG